MSAMVRPYLPSPSLTIRTTLPVISPGTTALLVQQMVQPVLSLTDFPKSDFVAASVIRGRHSLLIAAGQLIGVLFSQQFLCSILLRYFAGAVLFRHGTIFRNAVLTDVAA
jgi:hypothetical protein